MTELKGYLIRPNGIEQDIGDYDPESRSLQEEINIRKKEIRIARDLNDIGDFTIANIYGSSLCALVLLTEEQTAKVKEKGYKIWEDQNCQIAGKTINI